LRFDPRTAIAAALVLGGCASAPLVPPTAIVDAARHTDSYSAELRVGLRGPDVRGHASLIAAFVRPDRLRLEMPGPQGARFLLVARGDALTAVFPAERAVFEGRANAATIAAITGVELTPPAVMDLLIGTPTAEAPDTRVEWGTALPRRVRATLSDGTRMDVKITRPQVGRTIADAAFDPPPHADYRRVDAAEARDLWLGRR
jgi:outer membrane lipoprotein-sorting protein